MIGWFVLLAFLFAATHVGAVNEGAGSSIADLHLRDMNSWARSWSILIAFVGQFFCGAAG